MNILCFKSFDGQNYLKVWSQLQVLIEILWPKSSHFNMNLCNREFCAKLFLKIAFTFM